MPKTNTTNTDINTATVRSTTSTRRRSRAAPRKLCHLCTVPHHPSATPQQSQSSPSPLPLPPQPKQDHISKSLPNHQPNAQIPRPQQPQKSVVNSSGRRSTDRSQQSDSAVAAANLAAAYATRGDTYAHPHIVRQTTSLPSVEVNHPPIIRVPGATESKVMSSPPATDSSGLENTMEKGKNETEAVIRGRKVRITEGASLYSLCRSWMKNGADDEIQPQPTDEIITLPKPLPLSTGDTQLPDEKEGAEEKAAEEEDEENVDHLSAEDLLKRHVAHFKRVRAGFREKWLNRIARYKPRLALLLPPEAK